MDLLYLVVVLIVVVILIIVLFKVLDHLMILPAAYAVNAADQDTLTITDKDPPPNSGIAITVQHANSTQCLRTN